MRTPQLPDGPSTIRDARWRQTLWKARTLSSSPRTTTMLSPRKSRVWKSPASGMSDRWQTICQLVLNTAAFSASKKSAS